MEEIDASRVADYYMQCELDNIVEGENIQLRTDLYCNNTSRLLEALSFTYRANGVFDCIESGKYQWEERTINLDDITLTGMSEGLTDIIYSDEVQQCPLKFVEYIRRHRDDDRFSEIQTTMVPQNRQTLLLREDNGTLKMLDGSHRLISMIMNGIKSTNAYVAVANSNGARPMIGDAIFLRLRKLWEQTADPLFRASIEKTVIGMIKATRNGEQSVDSYWVRMAPNEEVRAVGRRLVDESKPIVSD